VIGSAGSEAGRKAIAEYCDVVVSHGDINRVLEFTNGTGVDAIIEMAAHKNLGADLKMLATGGTVVVVGSRGPIEVNPRDVMSRESTITAVMLWHAKPGEFDEAAEYIADGLKSGKLKPLVGQIFEGLEKAADAHDEVIEHVKGTVGKIVIRVAH
jgi:NADPH2:quinone reductase